jgi:hypothetical protein
MASDSTYSDQLGLHPSWIANALGVLSGLFLALGILGVIIVWPRGGYSYSASAAEYVLPFSLGFSSVVSGAFFLGLSKLLGRIENLVWLSATPEQRFLIFGGVGSVTTSRDGEDDGDHEDDEGGEVDLSRLPSYVPVNVAIQRRDKKAKRD